MRRSRKRIGGAASTEEKVADASSAGSIRSRSEQRGRHPIRTPDRVARRYRFDKKRGLSRRSGGMRVQMARGFA